MCGVFNVAIPRLRTRISGDTMAYASNMAAENDGMAYANSHQ